MENVVAVETLDGGAARWTIRGPVGRQVHLVNSITESIEHGSISWQSEPQSDIANSGEVRFVDAPADRGTYVTLILAYDPPGGKMGRMGAKAAPARARGAGSPRPAPVQAADGNWRGDEQCITVGANVGIPGRTPYLRNNPCVQSPGKGATRSASRRFPIPKSSIRAMRSSGLPRPRSAVPTFIFTTAIFPACAQATSSAMSLWAKSSRSAPRSTLKKGQRVVVPFTISCGHCFFCEKQQYSACDNSNPSETRDASELLMGHAMGAAFGYAHLTGGYAGGQAEYVRVPYSDVGPVIIPDDLPDDDVLFLSDILPTGWQAAVNADIEPGDTVAVWGCGPVGLFTIQSALLLGAGRVIAIDHFPARLRLAKQLGAEILDYTQVDVREALNEMTGGIGPDACIDCVGMESHGFTLDNILDQVKAQILLGNRPSACVAAGNPRVPQGRAGLDPWRIWRFCGQIPAGALMEKGLTLKSGQTHVQKYSGELLKMIQDGKFDMTSLVSHHASLEDAADMYRHWHGEQNEYTKIILKPGLKKGAVQVREESEHVDA